jgi:hypothetical protein
MGASFLRNGCMCGTKIGNLLDHRVLGSSGDLKGKIRRELGLGVEFG